MEHIGVGFNPNITPEESAQYARLAELNGYDSFWVHEQPLIRDPDHCLDRLTEYRKVGVQLPIIMPIGDIETTIETFRQS